MRGTWQTTGGGGGLGAILGMIGAVVLVAAIAGPVAAAAAELARIVVTIVAVVAALAVAGGAALLAYRVRHRHRPRALPSPGARVLPPGAAAPLQEPQRPAIEAARQVHLHFHGVTAEDVAAIIARQTGEQQWAHRDCRAAGGRECSPPASALSDSELASA